MSKKEKKINIEGEELEKNYDESTMNEENTQTEDNNEKESSEESSSEEKTDPLAAAQSEAEAWKNSSLKSSSRHWRHWE